MVDVPSNRTKPNPKPKDKAKTKFKEETKQYFD